jgi:hypothetical protein
MPSPDPERLRGIKTFPSLVKYLRDDLDWPIESENFDDLTFDFEPEELGIDPKTSAKIESIKQLRPLSSSQPWGIFFVKFEPKKLPVVALRRILGQLVIKKRASANRADQQTWRLSDLLFLSNYGENEQRQITFAHFSGKDDSKNLPTLKVLGWDDSDTALHIDHVHATLEKKLRWPDDGNDLDVWRKTWSSAFTLRHREVIETSKELAVRLAGLAQQIRKRANAILSIETENGPLRKLMEGFKEALIHDLTEDPFADMYAQTIAYGLLSARITNPKGDNPDELSGQMPITNPFLKELMETFLSVGGRNGGTGAGSGIDFDELGINEVVDLLDNSNMEAVVRDFGDKNPLEDPVIHFYELFLHEYDTEIRMQRGVFYTPKPVVSFIVRSVDEILRKEFGLEDGLADTTTWGEIVNRNTGLEIPIGAKSDDTFVQILDPATGTGTFLVEVIDLIHKTMVAKWEDEGNSRKRIEQLWNDYVPTQLLPRLHGYELLMAPYAIAHMKIGLKLFETNYHFGSEERAQIYLTHTLEPASGENNQLSFSGMFPALAHEAEAVNAIKRNKNFTVVIGNPPYSSLSCNMSSWIKNLVNDYLNIQGERIKEKSKRNHLQNDYIKFIRIADLACMKSPLAIFAYITSNSYLDGRTLRGLRWNLLQNYQKINIFNLYGDSKKRDAKKGDENVFDITEGVSIIFGCRHQNQDDTKINYAEIQGTREQKYQELKKNTPYTLGEAIPASAPYYMFKKSDDSVRDEFLRMGPSLDHIFRVNGAGLKTNRDKFATDEDRAALLERMNQFADKAISDEDIQSRYSLKENYTWKIPKARSDFRSRRVSETKIIPLTYRPFDIRQVYYDKAIVFNPRTQIMSHMFNGPNLAIVSIGQNESKVFNHAFISRNSVEIKMATHYGASVVFPLYLYPNPMELIEQQVSVSSNFNSSVNNLINIANQSAQVGVASDMQVLHYIYAILYSQIYRKRYAEIFVNDFPRIPESPCLELFSALGLLGAELTALHLVEKSYPMAPWNQKGTKFNCPFDNTGITLAGHGSMQVDKVSYSDETVWIDKKKTCGFRGVKESVWEFHIGGYQVCQKWLKNRGPKKGQPGRILTKEDIAHYQKIIVAISETIRIMVEIDEVIEEHGGWPEAFETK